MATKVAPAWEFDILFYGEVVGTLTVYKGTGHWSQPIRDTELVNEMVYAYEATVETNMGEFSVPVTREQLMKYRKAGHAWALEDRETDKE